MGGETVSDKMETKHDFFLHRVANYPFVDATLVQVTDLYGRTKNYNSLMKNTLDAAEKSVKATAAYASPIVEKFNGHIDKANTLACRGLDKLEDKAPSIKKKPNELVEDTKRLYQDCVVEPTKKMYEQKVVAPISAVRNYGCEKMIATKDRVQNTVTATKDKVHDTVNKTKDKVETTKTYTAQKVDSIKQYGYKRIDDAMQTTYGKLLTFYADKALTMTENCVDYYLPPDECEHDKQAEANAACEDRLARVATLTVNIRHRMYDRSVDQWDNLCQYTTTSLQKLNPATYEWKLPRNIYTMSKKQVEFLEQSAILMSEFFLNLPIITWMVPEAVAKKFRRNTSSDIKPSSENCVEFSDNSDNSSLDVTQ